MVVVDGDGEGGEDGDEVRRFRRSILSTSACCYLVVCGEALSSIGHGMPYSSTTTQQLGAAAAAAQEQEIFFNSIEHKNAGGFPPQSLSSKQLSKT